MKRLRDGVERIDPCGDRSILDLRQMRPPVRLKSGRGSMHIWRIAIHADGSSSSMSG